MHEEDIVIYDSKGRIIDELYQWDKDVSVTVKDLPSMNPLPEFHFCSRESDKAYVVSTVSSNGGITAKIPNIVLTQSESLILYVYRSNRELTGGRTICMINIPLVPRAMPVGYVYPDAPDFVDVIALSEELKKLRNDFDKANLQVDTEMSDTSQNLVQNKVIKRYVDASVSKPIGGRNLLLNSGVTHTNAEYRIAEYTPSRILKYGETVTVSICITPADKTTGIWVYNSTGWGMLASIPVEANKKQIITATFDISYYGDRTPENDIHNNNIEIYRQPRYEVTGESTIHWIKLEIGSTATDWTEAPEDIRKDIRSNTKELETLKPIAKTGSFTDLINVPNIVVGDKKYTIKVSNSVPTIDDKSVITIIV